MKETQWYVVSNLEQYQRFNPEYTGVNDYPYLVIIVEDKVITFTFSQLIIMLQGVDKVVRENNDSIT